LLLESSRRSWKKLQKRHLQYPYPQLPQYELLELHAAAGQRAMEEKEEEEESLRSFKLWVREKIRAQERKRRN
jgi:hypothetical protein